jgi:hypothetical protein
VGNFLFDGVVRLLHAVEGGDILSGMYGGRRECLLDLGLESEGFDIEAEICIKAKARGLSYGTLPITYADRVGDKKLNAFHDGVRIFYRLLQLAAAYSPLLIFILPGLILLIAGLIGVGLMQLKPLHFLNLPLAVNGTFLLGVIGSLGAQLIIFGLAVYAGGMAFGLRGRSNRTLDKVCQVLAKQSTMLAGLALGVLGAGGLTWLALDWITHGRGVFDSTAILVAMSMSMMLGFHLVSSSIFLTALKKLRPTAPDRTKEASSYWLSQLFPRSS